MIVVDASVVVDLLIAAPDHRESVSRALGDRFSQAVAPHLLDAEVGQVLRRLVRARLVHVEAAQEALEDLAGLPIVRWEHGPLIDRAFALRNSLTVYDGLYVALAEILDAPLVTADGRISRAKGHTAKVEVLTPSLPIRRS